MIEYIIILSLLTHYIIATRGALFGGLIANTFTPINENGTDIMPDKIGEYVNYLHNKGINTVYINGINGESLSLSTLQRQLLAETWTKKCHEKGMAVIVDISCNSIEESVILAKHAKSISANAITSMNYNFFKPTNNDILFQTIKYISDSVDLPYLYYHLSDITSSNIHFINLIIKCYENILNFEGFIYNDNKMSELNYLKSYLSNNIRKNKVLSIIFGKEAQFSSLLSIGIKDVLCSTCNYVPELYRQMIDYHTLGDFSSTLLWQTRSDQLTYIYQNYTNGNYFSHKLFASNIMDIEFGPPLLPLQQLDEFLEEEMMEQLTAINFDEWNKKKAKREQKWLIIIGTIAGVIFMIIVSIVIWRQLKKEKIEENLIDQNQS